MTKISSTELKQNTRKVLQQIALKPNDPIVIYTYNEPKVVLISYKIWQETSKEKPKINDLKKFFIKTKKRLNSSELIRTLRNEE